MKDEELLRPLNRNIRCEVYACKKIAKYSIGHPSAKVAQFHICEECLRTIVEQAKILLGEEPCEGVIDTEPVQEAGNSGEGSDYSVGQEKIETEPVEPQTEENAQEEPTEGEKATDISQEVEEPQQDVYICKYCGATFKKPEEKMKLAAHVGRCPKNPKNAKGE